MGKRRIGERKGNHYPGFTLIELLVVIAVMGVLASVAISGFSVWIPNFRLKSGMRSVMSAMQVAKLTAIKQNCATVIFFALGTGSSGTYKAFVDNGAGAGGTAENGVQDGTEKTIIEGTMPESVNLYYSTFVFYNNMTGFNNRGIASIQNNSPEWGQVRLKNTKSTRYQRVMLWTTGTLEIEESKDGSTWS